jgi:hypothetical protein
VFLRFFVDLHGLGQPLLGERQERKTGATTGRVRRWKAPQRLAGGSHGTEGARLSWSPGMDSEKKSVRLRSTIWETFIRGDVLKRLQNS